MPYNGSGSYGAPSYPGSWNPATAGATADPNDWNGLLADLSTALSTAICKDGQTTITADLPMSNHKLTGLSVGTGSTHSATYGQLLSSVPRNLFQNGIFSYWPMGTTLSIANGSTGYSITGAARWHVISTGAAVAVARENVSTGQYVYAMKITGAASITDVTVGYRFEDIDAALLAGQTCTVQWAVYNSTGASITPTVATRYPASSANDWTGSPTVDLAATNLQACVNGAWTTVAYTFAANANAVRGYEIKLDLGNNFSTNGKFARVANADLRITPNAVVGLNSAPPSVIHPSASEAEKICSRYHQSSYADGTAVAAATTVGIAGGLPVQNGVIGTVAKIPWRGGLMRGTAPQALFYDGAGTANHASYISTSGITAGFTNNDTTMTVGTLSADGFLFGYNSGVSVSGSYFVHYMAYADFW